MADHLVSLKRTKKDKKQNSDEVATSSHEDFPFGLSINLDDETLGKLGITKLPKVGSDMIVAGIGVVESISERSDKNKKSRNVQIQLTKLSVGPLKASKPETAVDAVTAGIKEA